MCPAEEFLREFARLECVALIGNVVPLKNTASSMSRDLHDHGFRDSGAAEISNRRPAEVME